VLPVELASGTTFTGQRLFATLSARLCVGLSRRHARTRARHFVCRPNIVFSVCGQHREHDRRPPPLHLARTRTRVPFLSPQFTKDNVRISSLRSSLTSSGPDRSAFRLRFSLSFATLHHQRGCMLSFIDVACVSGLLGLCFVMCACIRLTPSLRLLRRHVSFSPFGSLRLTSTYQVTRSFHIMCFRSHVHFIWFHSVRSSFTLMSVRSYLGGGMW